jgi:hypothetical protein
MNTFIIIYSESILKTRKILPHHQDQPAFVPLEQISASENKLLATG